MADDASRPQAYRARPMFVRGVAKWVALLVQSRCEPTGQARGRRVIVLDDVL
ncbi:MAG: hypothetical protein WAO83_01040 [Fuerstiella sp.]